jgi:hypothetical protein|nr:MAG TPA: hypothetical protein [Caudoviricetes sp.]
MKEAIDLLLQLVFELGQAYNYVWQKAGLDNVVDFNNIAYANTKGAMWNLKNDMSNLPELFKLKDKDKINELNKIADDLQKVKEIAKELLEGGK